MTDTTGLSSTRRGFLAGLLGLSVVAVLPKVGADAPDVLQTIDPYAIAAPPGLTYQWVRTALLGEADPANLQARIDNGWHFVTADQHPGAPSATLGKTIDHGGLVLMWQPTAIVQARVAAEQDEFRLPKGVTGSVNWHPSISGHVEDLEPEADA